MTYPSCAYAGARVWLGEQGLAGNRRTCQLRSAGPPAHFQGVASHREVRPSEAGIARGGHGGEGQKRYHSRRVEEVIREVVRGTEAAVHSRLQQTQRSAEALINTA